MSDQNTTQTVQDTLMNLVDKLEEVNELEQGLNDALETTYQEALSKSK